jgi:hypothetical protein
MNQFQVGQNNISYVGDNFEEWFGDMECEESKCEYTKTELTLSMNDPLVLKKIKPNKFTLGEILYLLPKLDKDEWNIFYCEDKSGVLRAVVVSWDADGWDVYAYSVESPFVWKAGDLVFSRNSSEPLNHQTSDTLTLEKAIALCKENGLTVSKNLLTNNI